MHEAVSVEHLLEPNTAQLSQNQVLFIAKVIVNKILTKFRIYALNMYLQRVIFDLENLNIVNISQEFMQMARVRVGIARSMSIFTIIIEPYHDRLQRVHSTKSDL